MDQKLKIDGTIGYGDPYLEFLIRHFKVFRLHATLHDAAGAVRAHSGKGPGNCYMIGRGANSSLLGHVTGLLFWLYANLFPPFIKVRIKWDTIVESKVKLFAKMSTRNIV